MSRCDHACCPEPDDGPPHEHPEPPGDCRECMGIADAPEVHPLEQRVNRMIEDRFGGDKRRNPR